MTGPTLLSPAPPTAPGPALGRATGRRVLVTHGWCRTAYSAAESLSRAGFRVSACSPSGLSMTRFSRFVSGFDRTPDPYDDPAGYVDALAEIVDRRRIDLLIPVHEDGLAIRAYRDRLPPGLIVAAPSFDDLARAMDKWEILRVAEAAGVDIPRTHAPTGPADASAIAGRVDYPLLVKTRQGNSGKGVFAPAGNGEVGRVFADAVARFGLDDARLPLLQERIGGELYGSCFLARGGEVLASFGERYTRCKGGGMGTSVLREPCDWPVLAEHTRRMARALGWTGIGHFDFVADAGRARAYLIEMNPRFWGALDLSIRNGVDFPRALATMLVDGEPDPRSIRPVGRPRPGHWVVGEMIAAVAEFRAGDPAAPMKSLARLARSARAGTFDDFRWTDPLPLLAEMAYYAGRFLASGGDPNPVSAGMVR